MTDNIMRNISKHLFADKHNVAHILDKANPAVVKGEISQVILLSHRISVTQMIVSNDRIAVLAEAVDKMFVSSCIFAHTVAYLHQRLCLSLLGSINIVCDPVCLVGA